MVQGLLNWRICLEADIRATFDTAPGPAAPGRTLTDIAASTLGAAGKSQKPCELLCISRRPIYLRFELNAEASRCALAILSFVDFESNWLPDFLFKRSLVLNEHLQRFPSMHIRTAVQ